MSTGIVASLAGERNLEDGTIVSHAGDKSYPGPEYNPIMHPDLRRLDLPPMRWIVPGLLPPGLTLLVSPPKTGKTWLKMSMEQAVAYGGQFLGIDVSMGTVISISLEDNNRRLQKRHRMLTPDELVPETIGTFAHYCKWYGETFGERVMWLEKQLQDQCDKGQPVTLLTIDTLRKFVGGNATGRNAYDFDCEAAQRLNDLGMRYDVAIVIPHHTNKIMVSGDDQGDWLDKVSGSAGLSGSSTTIMFLERSRGADTGVLHVAGWDVQDSDTPMRFKDGMWSKAADLDVAEARHSGVPAKILAVLRQWGALTVPEIVTQTSEPIDSVKKALQRLRGSGEVDNDVESKTWMRPGTPAATPVNSPPLEITQDREPEPLDSEPEPVPEIKSGNASIRKMIQVLSASHLHCEFKMSEPMKEKLPYESMFLGGRGGAWLEFPDRAPRGTVKSFDRKAAFFSKKYWVALGQLRRTGPMTWDQVKDGKLAGVFEIVVPEWKERNLLNPLGDLRRGTKANVTRPTLDLLNELEKDGLTDFPTILSGYVARGSESVLWPWQEWCLERRRNAYSPEQAAQFKAEDNQAFGSLRIVDPDKAPGAIDRPDWWYAAVAHHYAMMARYAHSAVRSGDPLVAVGNTDELVFEVPQGEDPATWVPSSMVQHVAANRFSVKAVRDGAQWFEAGGRGQR